MTGVLLTLVGSVAAYFFILRPIEEAKRTGMLHQGVFGFIIPICLIYGGVAMIATDLRDDKTFRVGQRGGLAWTRRGYVFQYGMLGTVALLFALWYWYIRSIGVFPL